MKKPQSAALEKPAVEIAVAGSRYSHRKFTPRHMVQALRMAHGCVHAAARSLQCSPRTVWRYIKKYPAVRRARDEARNLRVDLAELRLDEAVQKGEAWAVCFLLKTLGKRRGYIEHRRVDRRDIRARSVLDNSPLRRLSIEQLEKLTDWNGRLCGDDGSDNGRN